MAGIQEIKCKIESYGKRLHQSSKDRINICKELEQYILSLDPDVLLEILKQEYSYEYPVSDLILPVLIIHHTLMTSYKQIYINSQYQNNVIEILHDYWLECQNKYAANDYLTLYCNGVTPCESFQTLHRVWGSYPDTKSKLILYYCKNLLQYKHYDIVKQLINDNMEYFTSTFNCSAETPEVCISVMLYILSQSITHGRKDIIERTVSLINEWCYQYDIFDMLHLLPSHLVLSLIDKDCIPSIVNLKGFNRYAKIIHVQFCLIQCQILIKQNKHKEYQSFFEQHIQFIIYIAGILGELPVPCKIRQQYSVALMYYCGVSTNTHNTDLVITTIHRFQLDLLLTRMFMYDAVCYCYGGKKMCFNKKKNHNQTKLDLKHETDIYSAHPFSADRVNKGHQTESTRKSEILEKFYKYMIHVIEDKHKEEYSIDDIINETSKIVDRILHEEGYEYELTDIITTLCNIEMNSDIQDIMVQGLMKPFQEMVYSKEEKKLSTLMLDLYMAMKGNIFLTMLTQCVGDLLHLGEDINEKKILYKCFCIVRAACRRSEEPCVDIEKYIKHFTFISMFDKEEELMKLSKHIDLLIMLMFLLTTVTSGGHHKSAALKKYLSLKYEYDKAILYLLWCSGDVEINPGPTLKKLKPLRTCEKERKWIHETCSTLVKLVKGIPIDSKPKSLWKHKPDNWPQDQPFFDPNNKPKVCNDESHSDERLLVGLLEYCDKHGTSIPHPLQLEINEWKVGDKSKLFELFICQKEINEIKSAIYSLNKYMETPELKICLKRVHITIDLNVAMIFHKPSQSIAHTEIVRDLALTFCRIAKGLNPLEKSDGIWKVYLTDWNQNHPFYSPHNAGKRSKKCEDKHLVDNLLKYCADKHIAIPPSYNVLADEWVKWSKDTLHKGNKKHLHKVYTVWANTVIIEHSLKYLQLEGILNKPCIQKELENLGLKLDAKSWNLSSGVKLNVSSSSPDYGFDDSQESSICSPSSPLDAYPDQQSSISKQDEKDLRKSPVPDHTNRDQNINSASHKAETKENSINEFTTKEVHTGLLKNQIYIETDDDQNYKCPPGDKSPTDGKDQQVKCSATHDETQNTEMSDKGSNSKKRKLDIDNERSTCSRDKRRAVSVSDMLIGNKRRPKPVDVNTTVETQSGLNLCDDDIVSMVDDMYQDYTTDSDQEDNNTEEDFSTDLPKEILSYMNDYFACENQDEKLFKDIFV